MWSCHGAGEGRGRKSSGCAFVSADTQPSSIWLWKLCLMSLISTWRCPLTRASAKGESARRAHTHRGWSCIGKIHYKSKFPCVLPALFLETCRILRKEEKKSIPWTCLLWRGGPLVLTEYRAHGRVMVPRGAPFLWNKFAYSRALKNSRIPCIQIGRQE